MRWMSVALLFSLVLLSCASQKPIARPSYVPPSVEATDSTSLSPGSTANPTVSGGTAAGDAVYFIASQIASRIRKNRTQDNLITGLVLCHKSPSVSLPLPCGRLIIALVNQNGKTVTSGNLDRVSEFAFQVPRNQSYRIQVRSPVFHQPNTRQLFAGGQDAVLNLYEALN